MDVLPVVASPSPFGASRQDASETNEANHNNAPDNTGSTSTSESSDTAPPAPASASSDSRDTNTNQQTDQQTQASAVSSQSYAPPSSQSRENFSAPTSVSTSQSVVEAQVNEQPETTGLSDSDARRLALAEQQRAGLERLIEAVNDPPEIKTLSAAAADQSEVGNAETDGNPI